MTSPLSTEGSSDQVQPSNSQETVLITSRTREAPTTTLSGQETQTQPPTGELQLLSAVKILAGHKR